MIPLPLPPKIIQKNLPAGKQGVAAIFEIQGLYPGYGVTMGNALRRVLLTSLQGAAVTEVKIKGVAHEFSTASGVLEDVIMIILNIKKLRFKIFEGETQKVELKVKGDGEVKGADFKCSSQIKLVNPDLHIATITDKKTELNIEITVQKGIGYVSKDQIKKVSVGTKPEIGAIALDAIFTPIRNVNFQVENMRVGDRTDFDRLSLEIETDGIITPEEAFFEACEILIKHFNTIFQGKPEEDEKLEKAGGDRKPKVKVKKASGKAVKKAKK
ncbi:DNA-directed RNA polymerase subunit alpha [Patescibacteria group bacterium]|nr:DNA-directed RNA polymerase subunit alpha [Patescibacteria group bacterium]